MTFREEILYEQYTAWQQHRRREVFEPEFVTIKIDMTGHTGTRPLYSTDDGDTVVEEAVISILKAQGRQIWHSENLLPRLAGVLLYTDAIFAPIDGQFQSFFQSGPLDFGSADFYPRRKKIIWNIDRQLEQNPDKTGQLIYKRFQKYRHHALPGLYLKDVPDDFIKTLADSIPGPVWMAIASRYIIHPHLHGKGFPDLVSISNDNDDYAFLEVKSANDQLSEAQRQWLKFLNGLGATARVIRVI